ncbi:MAG: hypothetical protein Q9170_007434 [Blastenia crenularia]
MDHTLRAVSGLNYFIDERIKLAGSNLSVLANLDLIISKNIDLAMKEAPKAFRDSENNAKLLLREFSSIRIKLMTLNFDMGQVDNLVRMAVSQITKNHHLISREFPKRDWSVAVSKYITTYEAYSTTPPYDYFELCLIPRLVAFGLYDGTTNIFASDTSSMLEISDVTAVSASSSHKKILISRKGASTVTGVDSIFIELTNGRDVEKLLDKLVCNGYIGPVYWETSDEIDIKFARRTQQIHF